MQIDINPDGGKNQETVRQLSWAVKTKNTNKIRSRNNARKSCFEIVENRFIKFCLLSLVLYAFRFSNIILILLTLSKFSVRSYFLPPLNIVQPDFITIWIVSVQPQSFCSILSFFVSFLCWNFFVNSIIFCLLATYLIKLLKIYYTQKLKKIGINDR